MKKKYLHFLISSIMLLALYVFVYASSLHYVANRLRFFIMYGILVCIWFTITIQLPVKQKNVISIAGAALALISYILAVWLKQPQFVIFFEQMGLLVVCLGGVALCALVVDNIQAAVSRIPYMNYILMLALPLLLIALTIPNFKVFIEYPWTYQYASQQTDFQYIFALSMGFVTALWLMVMQRVTRSIRISWAIIIGIVVILPLGIIPYTDDNEVRRLLIIYTSLYGLYEILLLITSMYAILYETICRHIPSAIKQGIKES